MLRVLHCIHSLTGGGAETQVRLLVNASEQAGMQAAVCCVDRNSDVPLHGEIFEIRRRSKLDFSTLTSIRNVIRTFRPDVVHAWLPAAVTIPAMIAAKQSRVPAVFSYRSAMRFRRPIAYPEYLCAFATVSGVVSNNPAENSAPPYRRLFHAKHGTVIPNGLHIEDRWRKSNTETATPLKLIYVGRVIPLKNLPCLVSAVKLVSESMPVRLEICGEGEEAYAIKELARSMGIESQIALLGFRPDVSALMQAADILVLPSLWEGMPNAVMEAMAIGLPCVVSDIVSTRWVDDGQQIFEFFDPKSARELADKILRVASTPVQIGRAHV